MGTKIVRKLDVLINKVKNYQRGGHCSGDGGGGSGHCSGIRENKRIAN